jgi:tryptophanase
LVYSIAGQAEAPDLVPDRNPAHQEVSIHAQNHIDYVVEAVIEVYQQRETLCGLRIIDASPTLRHFTAKFEEI